MLSEQHYSGFAQFPDYEHRERFFHAVIPDDNDLASHAYMSGTHPIIVFDNLSNAEQRKLLFALEGLGRWIEDVKFDVMK